MSTDAATDSNDRTDSKPRRYPLERAFSTPLDRSAAKRIEPDDSGGWIEVHRAQVGDDTPIGHEEVTSS